MADKDNGSIFRQKSLDRINSPDQINDYIRVLSPAMWMVLLGIILLLLAGILWASLGRLELRAADTETGMVHTETLAPLSFLSD